MDAVRDCKLYEISAAIVSVAHVAHRGVAARVLRCHDRNTM